MKWRYCLPTYGLSGKESELAPEGWTHVLLLVDGGTTIPLTKIEVDQSLIGVYNILDERMIELAKLYQGG